MKWLQSLPWFNLGLSVIRGSKSPPVRPAILKMTITETDNPTHKQKAKQKQHDNPNDMTVGKP